MANDCIFCKIAGNQIKAQVVYEDPRVMAFRDVNPQAPVHVLVIPKKHLDHVSAVKGDDLSLLADMHKAAMHVAQQENLIGNGFRLVTNEGADGGQSVGHLHTHVLGGRALKWPPG